MRFTRQLFLWVILTTSGMLWFSCQDMQAIVDTNQEISGRTWSYVEKIRVPVKIDEENVPYNIYINLRHTTDYKYANIFLLIHQTGPDGKKISERKELYLAHPDGEWLGKGSGNLYNYQILIKKNYQFPKKGIYLFEIEQNMRDNPLREVTDAGLRVEKAIAQNP